MAEPTLQQVFGDNAAQTSTTLTITKADLASIGLTASASNTAESLLAAIIAKAQAYLTEANQSTNPDQSITISDSFESLTTLNNQQYRRKSKSVDFQKIDDATGFDPDDY